jgi:hypothetical protein
MDNMKFAKLMACLLFGLILLATAKTKGNTISHQPIKSEFEICMDSTKGDYTDWSCEWCEYLTTDAIRTIDCIDSTYSEDSIHIYRIEFVNGTGVEFNTRYELEMIKKHSIY